MALFHHIFPSPLNFKIPTTCPLSFPSPKLKLIPPKSSINADINTTSDPGIRRSSKKSNTTTRKPKRTHKTTKPKSELDQELDDFDDGVDFPYDDPPLICCFGAAQKEFLPTVRVSEFQMDSDIYSGWKMLQWDPPEFCRAPGGPPTNVAIAHVRLGGRAAFIGKVGDDEFGEELLLMMNKEKVQTRGVKIDENSKTGQAYMKIKFDGDGRMRAEKVKEAAEDSLLSSELNVSVLKEARMFHFNSEVLTSPSMHSTLFKAISWSKKFGSLIFFYLNLPLPLWKSRDETRELIKKAWEQSDIIEVSRRARISSR